MKMLKVIGFGDVRLNAFALLYGHELIELSKRKVEVLIKNILLAQLFEQLAPISSIFKGWGV